MCFYIREIETRETYKVDHESAEGVIRGLAVNFLDAINNLEFLGSEAPPAYEYLKELFKTE